MNLGRIDDVWRRWTSSADLLSGMALRMAFDLQPTIGDDRVALRPIQADDFDALYAVAADPLIWEQHPSKLRYQRDVFATYFEGAMQSKGALLVTEAESGEWIGCSRYYDLDESQGSVAIGYTFLARKCWGGSYNRALKTLMLDHAFRFVQRVIFHVGRDNTRSRTAMARLGGVLIGEEPIRYYGEQPNINVIYKIDAVDWATLRTREALSK